MSYGKRKIGFDIPSSIDVVTVEPGDSRPLKDPVRDAHYALSNPTGTAPLVEMLRQRQPKTVVVVVNDVTRPTPYPVLLPPLLRAFEDAGISDENVTFVIALGTHVGQSDEQNRQLYGDDIVNRFRFEDHDGGNEAALVNLGKVDAGYDIVVNRRAYEADFLITLGVIMPHYLAGYSGGRKSILPGLASHDTVAGNHSRMLEILDGLPPIDKNPISLEMLKVARKVGVDFILNAVSDEAIEETPGNLSGETMRLDETMPAVLKVVAGDVEQAWRAGVDVSMKVFEVPFDDHVDVAVVCADGYPRDLNAYQAQKALDHADRIVRPGGTIILAAECSAGWGNDVFEKWAKRGWTPDKVIQELKAHFELGGHKAYGYAKVAKAKSIELMSELSKEDTEHLWAKKVDNLQSAVDDAVSKYGEHARWAYMPFGSLALPVSA